MLEKYDQVERHFQRQITYLLSYSIILKFLSITKIYQNVEVSKILFSTSLPQRLKVMISEFVDKLEKFHFGILKGSKDS